MFTTMDQNNCGEELIFYGGDLHLEPCKQNFGQYWLDSMKENSARTAFIDPIKNITYTHGDVRKLSIRCALEMKARGLKKGDIISIIGRNGNINLLIPFISAIYLGAIVNPLHPDYSYNEIERMFNLTKPRMVFCDDDCETIVQKLLKQANITNCEIVLFDKNFSEFIAPHNAVDEETFHTTPVDVKNDLCTILCTSGTTGFIKGVMGTHEMYYISCIQFLEMTNPDEILLVYSPLSWLTAAWTNSVLLLRGAARIVAEYDPKLNLEIMSKYKIRWIFFQPLKLWEMIRHPLFPNYPDIPENLKFVIFGGSRSTREQVLEYRKIFKNAFVLNGYGSTEMHSGHARFVPNRDEDVLAKKIFSHGRPPPGVYWKIIDPESGKVLGRNQPGELLVKGPTLMKGYYRDPEATAKAIDKDGWFHSGDIVEVDDDDCLYVVGRCKELFKYKGWQVSPAEIEQVIRTHPGVENACVIGKPHETDGELPLAFIVKKANIQRDITEHELINYVNDRVSDVQKLRGGIIFLDSIPLTPTGKIRQVELLKIATRA